MKYSRQREEILKMVGKCDHPTADIIFALVREQIPHISLGTVYRNLNFLEENHFIQKVKGTSGKDYFDKVVMPHGHLECMMCGRLYDFEDQLFSSMKDSIYKKEGFLVDSYHILFTGVCLNCQKKEG